MQPEPRRPWWTSLWLALGVSLGTLLLGIFVSRYFFGLTFIAFPFVWMPRAKRTPRDRA